MRGTLLILDDEAYLREHLARLLTEEGYQVVTAATEHEGLHCLGHAPVDVVLTDLRLGTGSGLAVLAYIATHQLATLVIVLTGVRATDAVIAALRQGAYDYLPKPCDIDLLLLVVARACATIQDVTARRQAETQLHHELDFTAAITTHLGEGVYALDTDGRLTFLNPAAEALLGWTQSDLLGQAIHEAIHGHCADHTAGPAHICPLLAVLQTGQPRTVASALFTRRDGTRVPVAYTVSPIRTGGQRVGAVVVFHDITAQHQAAAAVRQSQAQLRALMTHVESLREAERTQLARDMHDDFGQQLTGLHMNLGWLKQKLGTLGHGPPVPALLERVADATTLVQGLLRSVHAIVADLRPSVLDKLGLGAALHEETRRFQARTAIAATVRLPDPELTLAPAVATALFRLFQECLTHVVLHTGATQVDAVVQVDEDWVTLCVQDNGRGSTDTAMDHPASLGLIGLHEHAARLGGEVRVAQGPVHGTLVTARLPQRGDPRRGWSFT